jgi:hypothetical protein
MRSKATNGLERNHLHPYDAGWLSLLLEMSVASERALREALSHVARAAIEEMEEKWERRPSGATPAETKETLKDRQPVKLCSLNRCE